MYFIGDPPTGRAATFPGKTTQIAQTPNLHTLHGAFVPISLVLCHTKQLIIFLFFKIMNSVEEVNL
jgi:hypothetical protein